MRLPITVTGRIECENTSQNDRRICSTFAIQRRHPTPILGRRAEVSGYESLHAGERRRLRDRRIHPRDPGHASCLPHARRHRVLVLQSGGCGLFWQQLPWRTTCFSPRWSFGQRDRHWLAATTNKFAAAAREQPQDSPAVSYTHRQWSYLRCRRRPHHSMQRLTRSGVRLVSKGIRCVSMT
jgi:hypothetical protein